MLLDIDSNSSVITDVIKIHFSVTKEVKYGLAVYVAGDIAQLGSWSLKSALRLSWNEGHQWVGQIIINRKSKKIIEFKYLISNWESPSLQNCQWEQGQANRKLSFENQRNSIICNHRWGLEKVILCHFVQENASNYEYFVIGNIPELGSWKETRQMKPINKNMLQTEKSNQKKIKLKNKSQKVFSYTFFINRNRKNIHYYYIKKGGEVQKERHPGRTIELSNLTVNRHPQCFQISYSSGDIQIYQSCQFNQLHFSKITDQIFVGAYLRTKEDFQKLRDQNIDAVLSIQSKEDYSSHCLSTYYLKLLCQEHGIKYYPYSIRDMSPEDFMDKSLGAFLLMRRLILEQNHKVYVHCSAGMYRSPQIIVIYLVLVSGYGLDEAIKMVTEKHPFARPNYSLLIDTLNSIGHKMSRLIIQS